jgi:hypothetical protein
MYRLENHYRSSCPGIHPVHQIETRVLINESNFLLQLSELQGLTVSIE